VGSALKEQIAYYRARASEYDQWFLRTGRYDRGEQHRRDWFGEVATAEEALAQSRPQGSILELACGTGLWTQRLLPFASDLTAVDASPEVLAINRRNVSSQKVEYFEADLFEWAPKRTYDFVFFSFWLSHVPPERFAAFWELVASALRPGGSVFFVDSLYNHESTPRDQRPINRSGVVERKLNDGSTYEIIKMFYEPEELRASLLDLGWSAQVDSTGRFFIYGLAQRGHPTAGAA
jgi:demethylmenaquinone methyltransferase/2-methoxy-6-polyprenyl-1,4-benzoquinol methylase